MVDWVTREELCRLWGCASIPDVRTNLTRSNYYISRKHAALANGEGEGGGEPFSIQEGDINPVARPVLVQLGVPLYRVGCWDMTFYERLEAQREGTCRWQEINLLKETLQLAKTLRQADIKKMFEDYALRYNIAEKLHKSSLDLLREIQAQEFNFLSVTFQPSCTSATTGLTVPSSEKSEVSGSDWEELNREGVLETALGMMTRDHNRQRSEMCREFDEEIDTLKRALVDKVEKYEKDFRKNETSILNQIFNLKNSSPEMQVQSVEEDLYNKIYG